MLLELLARSSSLSIEKLARLAETADRRYKVYEIPKRSGGTRTIEHPSRDIKAIQRWVAKAIFSRLPVHEAAMAYQSGKSIRANAEMHRKSRYTSRYDFANFFPSFRQQDVELFVSQQAQRLGLPLTKQDIRFVGNIVCRKGRLTIGAPSSPIITNTMMFEFDHRMYDHCRVSGLTYTRYADDIFVSSREPGELNQIDRVIVDCKRPIPYLNLRINRKKTVHLSRKYHREITGIVITPDGKLSVGRQRKREIKALIHQWVNEELPLEKILYMRGLLAFARDIEPEFERVLRAKYGDAAISKILKQPDLMHQPEENSPSFDLA